MYDSVVTIFALLYICMYVCMVLNTVYASYGESIRHLSICVRQNVLEYHYWVGFVSNNYLIILRKQGKMGNCVCE